MIYCHAKGDDILYCDNCGSNVEPGMHFCSNCGYSLDGSVIHGVGRSRKAIFIPLITAFITIIWLMGYYAIEMKISMSVDSMCHVAETEALSGNIDDAIKIIDKAINKRPNDITLNTDKKILQQGKDALALLDSAEIYVKSGDYSKAESDVRKAETEIGGISGDIFTKLNKIINDKKGMITVLKIKKDMNSAKSIEELIPLISQLDEFDTDESRDTSVQVRKQIGSIAYDKANEYLKVKDFNSALNIAEEGLQYDMGNDKLSSFKDTISKQKAIFEKVEKESTEQAMEAAAKEEDVNKTEALELLQNSGSFNSYGDYIIRGSVKNIATKPVSMAKVFYSIYNSQNNLISSSSTYIYPNYINPGETGNFESTEYGIPEGSYVKVFKITWILQ